jgi:pyrimidine operon attenuation protein/uracil phosphoribosyltransferase
VMKRFYEFFNQVQTLEKHARLIIEDVDKAGYTYRNLVEAIKILSRPEQVSL